MLNKIKEVSFRANIEPVWNTKVHGKLVELGFLELNYFSREERGQGLAIDNLRFSASSGDLPPVLVPIPDQAVYANTPLTFTASATDSDQPPEP